MGPISGISTLNANSSRLASLRREAEKRGKKETAISGARSTTRLRTVTWIAAVSIATVVTIASPTRATLPSLVHVTPHGVATPCTVG